MKPKRLIQNARHGVYQKFIPVSLSILSAFSVSALSPTVEQFVKWETQANEVSARNPKGFQILHYEIPLAALQKDFASYLDPKIKTSLIFKKNGEDYVRWIINPEDTKWHQELAVALKKRGLDINQYKYFTAYLTASRSMILEDPVSGAQFSAKVSTNQTGGMWKDKKQDISDARQVRMVSDFVQDTANKTNFDHIIIESDPLQLGMKDVDQAMLVRSLADLPQGDRYYLPGFSALHEETGKKIAALNGSKNPAEFWNEHYNKPLGRAVAEFAAHFGITYDSPHSQNFLIELDSKMKPTGRIVFRDFGDSYALKELFVALNRSDFLQQWESGNIVRKQLHVGIGTMHGNIPPRWLSEAQYRGWGKDFYEAFEETFSTLTGIPEAELRQTRISYQGSFSYFNKDYPLNSPAWKNYLNMAKCFTGSPVTESGTPCPKNLIKKLKPSARTLSPEGEVLIQAARHSEIIPGESRMARPHVPARPARRATDTGHSRACTKNLQLFFKFANSSYFMNQ